ncbi:hypothetical protein [Streptosporangium sp. V21-05]|uniref:hypothetical protein n=1 Tax=Streptosporangium sp. V21-05 TaxID=3446115 RepID=UPI003F52DCEC
MDVKSPGAAGSISRPSPPPSLPAATEPSRVTVALRRAGIAVTGVGVAGLTAAACVLSFEDLRALAVAGRAPADLAYLYPAAFDALLVIAMIGVLLLRGGWWPVRLQAGVILTLLFAGAAAAEVSTAMRMAVDEGRAAVVVAVAPWVTLILALWLWLLLIKHAAARRAASDAALSGLPPSGRDIVPFPEAGRAAQNRPGAPDPEERWQAPPPHPEQRPAHPGHEDHSAHGDHPGHGHHSGHGDRPGHPVHPGHLVHHPAAEIMLDPHSAPPLEAAPHHELPAGEPVVGPTAAPETPEVTDIPQDPPPPRGPAAPLPGKPMRWGDLVRPRQGDLLVHPPRPAVRAPEPESGGRVSERVETWDSDADLPRERTALSQERTDLPREQAALPREQVAEVSERDADTQPILAVKDRPVKDRPAKDRAAKDQAAKDQAANVPPGEMTTERTARTATEAASESASEAPVAARETRTAGRKAGKSPDPAHGAEAAEAGEEAEARSHDEDGSAAPPSGRMRSTPVPPGE